MKDDLSAEAIQRAMRNTQSHYEEHAQTVIEKTIKLDISHIYVPFLTRLPPKSHILDAGCGSGRDSLFFIQQGHTVIAIDISAQMVEHAATLIQQPVLRLALQQLTFTDQFDGIWASQSLLHVPRSEIDDVMSRLSRALKIGGLLYASFMVGDRETTRGGLFFNDYTEERLELTLQKQPELSLIECWQAGDPPPAQRNVQWLHALVEKRS